MKVQVFGCGPAGLMAAHAAAMGGHDIIIQSKPRKSHMRGAQYLHSPIPVVTDTADRFIIEYLLEGTAEGYRHKVYGAGFKGDVSPETLSGKHNAWDIRSTYDRLWEMYGSFVHPFEFSQTSDLQRALDWAQADVVISTVPAPLLCAARNDHAFTAENIWSSDQAVRRIPDNTVVCNGELYPAWYRAAQVHGWNTVEWPERSRPPLPVASVIKPLANTCNCFPSVLRMGRYGLWEKGVLSDSAYWSTSRTLREITESRLF